jgi:hypothetical protein
MGTDVTFIVVGFEGRDERDRFLVRAASVLEDVGLSLPSLDIPTGARRSSGLDQVCFVSSEARYLAGDSDQRNAGDWSMIREQALALLSVTGYGISYKVLYTSDDIQRDTMVGLLEDAARGEIRLVDQRWLTHMDQAYSAGPVGTEGE